MAIKIYKRNTASRRNMSIVKSSMITDRKPEKSLLAKMTKKAGRSGGKISVRHQGGGAKQRYRKVDFMQDKFGIWGRVASIEKDPVRSAFIALVIYADGEKRYVLAPEGLAIDQKIISEENAPIKLGNRAKVKNIPIGTVVSNLELFPNHGGQIARSAGSGATLTAIDQKTAQVKMSSGEIRLISSECYATIGQVSNFEHNSVNIGKAGRKRHMGVRPGVRGSAMNPVDHPHGGGEGRQGIGLKHPKTPWGKIALGKKTRKKKKYSNKFIIKRRTKRK
ncbi:MAG: 50S ribosomal protein L2 [Candidatus Moranbacteria bacterium GW2011_GWF2_36_839]|nr:MAG: 50S ribosomal protein L2 [Candidatus Moranbacteria bacterium GW2011_GWF1_36_78]KKQ16623.1 MAG: 50S ribosomal protein L2 [Candidatus Moranbacteria bacterium GW2011_GWF2_36_839]HAT73525.1 50S ribosomal protein L2 [Candidatus Moranbacteria bacterium]HBY11499.1 50S ribosomal protein L2 [Candidatus Moranbacteria bacterium]